MKSYGQTAYDAYYKLLKENPDAWEDLDQSIRDAWCKAGEAVAEQARKDVG